MSRVKAGVITRTRHKDHKKSKGILWQKEKHL